MISILVLLLGIFFGVILTNGEVISWFRIQEMFRFNSFHMYGVLGSAIIVGSLSMMLIRKLHLKTVHGEPIVVERKELGKGTVVGGVLFGIGWAFTGACPGPLYALVGNGYGAFLAALLSAICGTLVYGLVRKKLPH